MKKNKMSETRQKQIEKSSCYECAFRYPMGHNPSKCLYGIRDDLNYHQDDQLRNCPNCDHFIPENLFKRNMDNMLGISKDLKDWAEQIRMIQSTVSIDIPSNYIPDLVDFLTDRGMSVNTIRNMFKIN